MKTIRITDEDWKWLHNIKMDANILGLDEVVNILVIHCKEAIKKGDLEIIKQDDNKKTISKTKEAS